MRVAIVINDLTVRGGTHKQVLRLCEYLEKQGVYTTIYTKYHDPAATYCEFSRFPIVSLYQGSASHGTSEDSIFQKVRRKINGIVDQYKLLNRIPETADIINVHDNGFISFMIAACKHGKKVVWQINDLPHCFHQGNAKGGKNSPFHKYERAACRKATQAVSYITVNVTKNKERVQNLLGCDAKVFYCGVDVNPKLRIHSGVGSGDRIQLLSTGVFYPYRNYETLVRITERLRQRGVNVYLDIIGAMDRNIPYAQSVAKLVEEKNLGNYIKLWGQVDDETYVRLHDKADVFAFINIDQSWGLAVFEAMSCGLPVIVSDSVGAIELLHDQKDAVIMDPLDVEGICDCVERLLSDKQYYAGLSANAVEAVKGYTWDNLYSERMFGLFNELTENSQ